METIFQNLKMAAHQVMLKIQDDGVGIALVKASRNRCGYGLTTMRERAQRLGGRLELESPANGGTMIRVRVPLQENGKTLNHTKPNETVKN